MVNNIIKENTAIVDRIAEFFKAGVHFGHKKSKSHPKMRPYIFSTKNSVQFIDLQKSVIKFDEAVDFLKKIVSKANSNILFVGTKPAAKKIIEEAAKKVNMPYVAERWMGGILTNFKTISKRVGYMEDMEKKKASGELEKYTKKEKILMEEELKKLQRNLSGLRLLKRLPAALFVVDTIKEDLAVKEALKLNIPIVALTDTDADPSVINYPIPSNDDAASAIKYLVEKIVIAIEEGKKTIKKEE